MYESRAINLYVIKGVPFHLLKVHKNPYFWVTKKTIVVTITVHSYINSGKGNC